MEVPKIDDRDKNVQIVDTGESPIELEATRVLYPEVDKEVPVQAGVELSDQDNLGQAFKKLRKPVEISLPKDAASLAAEGGLKTIRPYIFAAEPKNVEDMATALRLSKEFGVAPALASAQKEFFDKTSRANRIDSDPAFASWASQSEDNTSLAAQFPEEIGKAISSAGALGRLIELGNERYTPDTPGGRLEWEARREIVQRSLSRTFAGLGPEDEYDESLLAAVPRGVASGVVNVLSSASEGINFFAEAGEEHFDGTASRRGKMYGAGQGPSERLSIEGEPIGSLDSLERIASSRESFREFSSTLKGNYQPGTFGAWLGDAAAVVPQFALQVLLGVATGGVGTLAGKAGQALLMGEQIFGSSYSGYRSDGVGVDAAALGAGLNAVLQTPFEIIGVKYLPFGKLAGLTRGQATRRITGAFLAEPATETLQGLVQYGVDAEVYGLAGGRSQAEIGGWLSDNLSGVFKSSLYQGLVAGPFGLASGIANVRAINQANKIRAAEDKTFEYVQALPFKDKLPGLAEDVARHAGANYHWQVAGSDVQALYQVHPALLEKLGIRISEVEEATAMGQPVPIDAARAMAVLSPEEYNAVKPVVQGFEYGPDRFVDMVTEEELKQENSRITEMAEAEQKERADFKAEQERLKAELSGGVKDVEGLRKQAVSTGKGVGNVADSVLELMSRMAQSIAERSGEKPADILRRINVQSEKSALEASRKEHAFLKNMPLEERSPLLAYVKGKLDAQSLRQTWPDAYKEIRSSHGLGLFRKKENGGLPVDELASELVERGLLPHGSGADELVELLKSPSIGAPAYTDADLVKLRNENPTLYQTAPAVESEAFKAWFGDSQVVNDDGSPLVVYHATDADIEAFDLNRLGENTQANASHDLALSTAYLGTWFNTQDLREALYAENLYPCYLSIQNPYSGNLEGIHDEIFEKWAEYYDTLEEAEEDFNPKEAAELFKKSLIEQGYDGMEISDTEFGETSYVAFYPEQIKSINNRGTFDTNDPRILYQESDLFGSLQMLDSSYLITLFKGADLSTLLHETGHIFLEEMERITKLEIADMRTLEDYNVLKEWWSRFDDDVELKREYDARVKNTPRFDGKDFESLAPDEKADARKIVEKEYFARGFEKYLLEGEAPSSKLREVFQRFRKWLLRIYGEAAKALGVELNPDVRRVFDRLLASDMEVEHAAIADQMFTLTDSMKKALGLSDEQAARHMVLLEEAKAAAIDTVIKKRGQDSRVREKRWKEEAEAALANDPAYASLARVRGDRVGVLKLSTEAVKEMYGEDYYKAALKKLGPGVFLKEGGNNPDDVAYILGFGSGQLMIDAWLNNPSKTAAVKAHMEGRRADFDSRVDPYEALLETQEAAIQAAVLGEYTALKVKESFKAIKQEVLKRIASDRFQDFKASKAVSPKQFLRNMELSGRRWARLIAEKDFEGALKANTEYRLNLEFYKLAVAKKEGIKKAVKAIKRFTDKEKNPDGIVSSVKARYAVDFIAARFGLKNPNLTLQENKGVEDIQSWTEEADQAGYDIDISPMHLTGQPGDWREMSVEALDDLFTELLTIAAVDRDMKAIEIGGKREDIKAAAKEAADVIASHKRLRPLGSFEEDGVIISAARSLNMMHTKMEFMCELMDGGEAMGKNWQLVYNRMREAENKYTTMFKALSGRFKSAELFGMYTPRELEKMNSQVVAAGANQSLTKAKAIMVALNMGTESNMNRLETGLGLSRGEISRIVDTALDARDWKFVQGVWATFESYKEEAFGLEEKLTGRRPKSVPPRLVRTKFGNIQGGYFPIVYDPKRANPVQKERMQIGTRSIYSLTQKGHLKDRASQGAGTPLLLDMGVIARKLDDLVTDICFREPSRDVFKILNNNTYRETVRAAYGEQVYSRMVEWLEDSVKENKQQTGFDAFLRWGRIGGTTVAMGLKVTTIAQQVLGLLQSWDRIGIKALLKGFAGVYSTDIQKTAENFRVIREKSAFMDARMGNYDRDMKDAFTTFNSPDATPQGVIDAGLKKVGLSRPIKAVQQVSFKPIAAVQYYAVDVITWMGAYQQAIQRFHGDESKSVAYADQAVRMTQGSGDTVDLSSIQRGGELAKAATMFYSYFNVLYNLAGLRVADVARNRDAASVGRAAQSFMLLVIVPALLGEYLSGRGWEGDDDEDELPAWVVKNLAAYSLGVSPFTRWTTGAMEGFGVNFTGATRGAESLINLINQIKKVDEMDGKKAAKYALQLSGYALALPAGQAEITLFNLIDYMDGTTQDYELRDLIFRRQESRR